MDTFLSPKQLEDPTMELTAIVRKGERQYVALCPELDVASQGKTVKDALSNLKEACALYVETMGIPEGTNETIITRFEVVRETPAPIRA